MAKNNIGKILICGLFIMAGILLVVIFITSTTYTQLAIGSLLYPPLIYLFLKANIFSSGTVVTTTVPIQIPQAQPQPQTIGVPFLKAQSDNPEKQNIEIIDIDKRAFLKLIGAAGLSFFIFSAFSKKIEGLISNRDIKSTTTNQTNVSAASQTEGYKISEIYSGEFTYYGFVNPEGNWYIMKEDPTAGSFRYFKGVSEFSKNWNNRENLKYDYFHKVFN
jgi:hypothetical protein